MSVFKSILRLFSIRTEEDPGLRRWKSAETRDVKKPRDPRTKYCVANIGRKITVTYYGTPRTIKPIRVFTKPMYRKTYVEAEENGERKTFDIDDMEVAQVSARRLGKTKTLVAGSKGLGKRGKRKQTCSGCGCLLAIAILLWLAWRFLS